MRVKPTPEVLKQTDEKFKAHPEAKIISFDYTLGAYDAVLVTEGPDVKACMKLLIEFVDIVETETLVAIPREEIREML